MLTLAEAAKLKQDPLRQGVLETFVQESSFMDLVPFFEIQGSAYSYNEEGTLPGVEYRAVNSAYAESTGTVNQKSEAIVIAGGEADVDTFIVRTQGNLNDNRALQERSKIKAMAYQFQNSFINGDVAVDANSFDGLRKRIVGTQVLTPTGDGIDVLGADDDDRHTFLDFLDELIGLVPGIDANNGLLIMNSFIKQKIRSSARRLTIFTTEKDELGNLVERYAGLRMVDAGLKADGSLVLPQNEPDGNVSPAADTSSIYAVKLGRAPDDQAVTGLTNGGMQVEDLGKLQGKPAWRTRIEFFHGLGLFGGKAAARARRVKNA
jgi:hypothetical protein